MDTLSLALSQSEEIKALRHHLHRHPELGNQEFETAAFLCSYLTSLGLKTERLLDTAVVATLIGGDGPTVALRADMDALPLREQTGCDFSSSSDGVMHACGHDVHMASALGTALLLSKNREQVKGTVKFIFQPDEEGTGGAERIIHSGILEGTRAVFGGHVAPDLPLGTIGVRYGKFYASSDTFTVSVKGKGTHGATPEKGNSALLAAAEMVGAIASLQSSSPDRFVLSVGTLHSGSAGNIIPEEAVFKGILRTLGKENREEMKGLLVSTLEAIAEKRGVKLSLEMRASYGGIVNTKEETAILERAAQKVFGKEKVVRLEEPTMTTEDFGYYVDAYSGSFCHLGAGCTQPLHNPSFLPDDKVALYGAALYAEVLLEALEK